MTIGTCNLRIYCRMMLVILYSAILAQPQRKFWIRNSMASLWLKRKSKSIQHYRIVRPKWSISILVKVLQLKRISGHSVVCCTNCAFSICPSAKVRWQYRMVNSPYQTIPNTQKACINWLNICSNPTWISDRIFGKCAKSCSDWPAKRIQYKICT